MDKEIELTPPAPTVSPDKFSPASMDKEKESIHPVSIADWLITLLVLFIPVINVLMLIVWSFRRSTHRSKANFSKAVLLLLVIFVFLLVLVLALFGVTFFDFMSNNADFVENPFKP